MTTSHAERKRQHLAICLREDVRSDLTNGLERYHLIHQALPELALDEVDTGLTFLGRRLRAPLLISPMTGGVAEAREINRTLARAAQEFGLALGLGSQRAALEDATLEETYRIRDLAPEIPILANLGAVQLNKGYGVAACLRAIEMVRADALVLHLNPLQEALQPEGDTAFAGLTERIAEVCSALDVPVIVKEVGSGISLATAHRLREAGVWGLDVAGAGGTSWSEVERHRAADASAAEVAAAFRDWGLPTALCLSTLHAAWPAWPLIASGGIRDGVAVAKCLALGAQMAGLAHALLAPAVGGELPLRDRLRAVIQQLRVAMFCVGARTLADLTPQTLMEV